MRVFRAWILFISISLDRVAVRLELVEEEIDQVIEARKDLLVGHQREQLAT